MLATKIAMLLTVFMPIFVFLLLAWMVTLPMKRFFSDNAQLGEAVKIVHSAILIGVFVLSIQAVYSLYLLEGMIK